LEQDGAEHWFAAVSPNAHLSKNGKAVVALPPAASASNLVAKSATLPRNLTPGFKLYFVSVIGGFSKKGKPSSCDRLKNSSIQNPMRRPSKHERHKFTSIVRGNLIPTKTSAIHCLKY